MVHVNANDHKILKVCRRGQPIDLISGEKLVIAEVSYL